LSPQILGKKNEVSDDPGYYPGHPTPKERKKM
jgi:hypothetical protein